MKLRGRGEKGKKVIDIHLSLRFYGDGEKATVGWG